MSIRLLITIIIISFILLCAIHPSIWFIINNQLCLKENCQLYHHWFNSSIPIYIQFYFFNLTNPYEFQNGAKPKLKQLGPYTYYVKYNKYNIKHHYNNYTIKYQQYKQYYFNSKLSIGNETDQITHVNLGFVAIATKLESLPWLINYMLELYEKYHHYQLIQIKTIHELLWGYNDELLLLLSNYGFNITRTKIGLLLNDNNNNNTLIDDIIIDDGLKDSKNLGKIIKYNNKTSLNYWTTMTANMMNGTDGTIYHTDIKKQEKPYLFIHDICRSIQLTRHSTKQMNNFNVFKYILSEDTFKSGEFYDKNKGFCLNWSNCFKDGVLDMSTCQPNSPIVISQPHFLNADQSYQNAIDGIQPNNDEYNTTIYIEPTTGLIIKAQMKLQINIVIKNNKKIKQLSNISNILLPLVYFNESVHLNQTIIDQINMLLIQLPIIIQYVLKISIVFNVLLLCSIIFKLFKQNRYHLNDQRINEENQWLLSHH
ncbi:unnamed protein product [Schistosoma spindalis]|nr:unnamed protein product [Schistosoma spindale]